MTVFRLRIVHSLVALAEAIQLQETVLHHAVRPRRHGAVRDLAPLVEHLVVILRVGTQADLPRLVHEREGALQEEALPLDGFAPLPGNGEVRHHSASAAQDLDAREVDAEAGCPHVELERLVALHGVRRLLQERVRAVPEFYGDVRARNVLVAVQPAVGVRGRVGDLEPVQLLEVLAHERRASAVESGEEVVEERLHRKVGVPHPLREQPRLELREPGVASMPVPLLEERVDAVVAEELHVALERVDVGEGIGEGVEVRHVVPQVEARGLLVPRLDVVDELHVLDIARLGKRTRHVALDRAEARHHVVAQLRLLRRLARVRVGKRLDDLVRKLLLHRLGDRVDKPDHGACVRLLLGVHRRALRALAVVVPVVLADAVVVGRRVPADMLEHVRGDDAQHVGVREAELRTVLDALALHHAEILGVLVEVLLGRQKMRERVAAAKALAEASRGASVSRTQAHRRSVRAIVRGKVAVEHVPPERLAVRKRGFLRIVQIAGH